MTKYKNFYETLEEADRRLHDTIITYDGEPVRVVGITNHKPDGIFRMYCWPVRHPIKGTERDHQFPIYMSNHRRMSHELGAYLDHFMEEHKDTPLLRKHANSPAFNKFRPFPLGMMNVNGRAVFLERSPDRSTKQGLTSAMIDSTPASLDGTPPTTRGFTGKLAGPEFHDCVKGNHPSAKECLENLFDPHVTNNSVAFHRNFAFVRGPMDTFFLAYKTDVVGFVPANTSPTVELGKKFAHLKELVQETGQISEVRVRG